MDIIAVIGTINKTIAYVDRPTVKVIIKKDDKILLLNDGLLPGGGVDDGESNIDALKREAQEELGASIETIEPIGTVIQYRDFLQKKYIVHGFTCELVDFNLKANPQDEGERKFKQQWLSTKAAIEMVDAAIADFKDAEIFDDSVQGKLFNLMTTRAFLLKHEVEQ